MWLSSCRTVAVALASGSATAKSGRYWRIGASRSTLSSSMRRITVVPVNVFVVEPIRNRVSPSTGVGWSTLVTPYP